MRASLALLFFIMSTLAGFAPARAESPGMASVVEFIKNQAGAAQEDGSFLLSYRADENTTTIRYTPVRDTAQDELRIETVSVFSANEEHPPITCRSVMIDRGAIGAIGPRDGSTSCTGALGYARIAGAWRAHDYAALIGTLAVCALAADIEKALTADEPDTPEQPAAAPEPAAEDTAPPAPAEEPVECDNCQEA